MEKDATFPARTVIDGFSSCEQELAAVLRVVPWCEGHKEVWSPALTTVIMESCSQLDSLWGFTAWLSPYVQKKKKRNDLTILDYFHYFGNTSQTPLGNRWVVFWGGDPLQVRPFQPWNGVEEYQKLDWWNAYNKLKHDRLEYREKATLSFAVDAMAALFLAILANEHCRYAVEAAGWLTASSSVEYNPKASLGEDSPSIKDNFVLAETVLFSYPVGWCNAPVKKSDEWHGNASFRFKHWFWEYESP